MAEPLVDVDLDALAPQPKWAKLDGKRYRVPGDMPLELFMRIQAFEQRAEKGEAEVELLAELANELLELLQVYTPTMKKLPPIGVLTLMQTLGAIYSSSSPPGEPAPPNRAARRAAAPSKKRTPSPPRASKASPRARPATSR
jgi:hypothetical protein